MGGGVWTTLATNVLRSRWFVVVAGIWIQSTYGTAYCFGVYSQSLKLAMDYNQETLNTLAVFKTLGGAVGIVSGLLYDLFPWPWLVLAIGAVQNVFGYFMMWLAITARIARPPLWQMCVFLYVGTNSSTFAATAVVVTCLKIFPSNRGIVIGFLKGFVALGAAIMTQLFYVLYPGDPQSFLLMVSWLPALVSLLFMGVIRPIPPAAAVRVQGDHEEDEGSNFNLLLVISFLLGGFLMGVIILQNVVQLGHSTMLVIACLIIFVLVFLPFGVVVRSELASYYKQPTTLQEPLFTDEQRNLNSSSGSQFHSQEQSEFVAADLTEEGYDHLEDSDKTQIQSNNRHNNNSIPSTGQPKQPSPLEAGLTSKFFHPLISISSHKEKKSNSRVTIKIVLKTYKFSDCHENGDS
ncbi:hypothetical protein BDL97_15G057800 [Sphagnum fallax]|nr:hypothetical protein BDL97_15G057800 [Sphagnum fallax]KAH8939848.1 hypothetical protein BDL97_15G057800 [Sphagnum fallax]KAH8939849.1 hypothetical protein BDL97_15G057800 [Sphagnum fallax]KAH8939850.1 hypothetical protein BDL97_15G057800 [Sphagnum fallax]